MRDTVEGLIGAGADVIKLIVTGAVLTRGTKVDDIELPGPLIAAAVDAAAMMTPTSPGPTRMNVPATVSRAIAPSMRATTT